MIVSNIKYADHCRGISRALDLALDYLSAGQFDSPTGEKVELGEGAFARLSNVALKKEKEWEAHKRYIDIHFCLEAGERISCMDTERISGWRPYDAEKDCMLAPGTKEGVSIVLSPGDFVLTFPEDAHIAGAAAGEEKAIRKILVKIPV